MRFNMNELATEKTMTVKEMAEVMNVSVGTIIRAINTLYPGKIKNGVTTYISEAECANINKHIHSNKYLCNSEKVTTNLEMAEKIVEVMQYLNSQIDILRMERDKAQADVKMLVHDFKKLYTTTEIAKELHIKSAIELNRKLMHDFKIQFNNNGTWVLYSDYADKGYTSIKETVLDSGKVVYDRLWTGAGRKFILDLFDAHK